MKKQTKSGRTAQNGNPLTLLKKELAKFHLVGAAVNRWALRTAIKIYVTTLRDEPVREYEAFLQETGENKTVNAAH